jgi:hypothetical protein
MLPASLHEFFWYKTTNYFKASLTSYYSTNSFVYTKVEVQKINHDAKGSAVMLHNGQPFSSALYDMQYRISKPPNINSFCIKTSVVLIT